MEGRVPLSPDISEAAADFRVSPTDSVLGGSNASPSPRHTRALDRKTKCLWEMDTELCFCFSVPP